ncbi:hypothetical protein BD779DRAFT_1671776 [Infundibulicybe gibba]|nr:hypothetical protein BD779DRAFT_1671776 [Infundibulicybe gibba]
MSRIVLPAINGTSTIEPPAQPSSPPTHDDVVAARHLCGRLMYAHRIEKSTTTDLVKVMVYEPELLSAVTAADGDREPAWFERASRRVLQPLNNRVDAISDSIEVMKLGQGKIRRLGAIAYNCTRGAGEGAGLEIVPFVNGMDPTEPPNNLPPLTSRKAVRELNAVQRDAYYQGYELPDQIRDVGRRIALILIAIGSSAV